MRLPPVSPARSPIHSALSTWPRHAWTDALLIAAAVVLAAVVFVDAERPGQKELSARSGMLLHAFREQDATRITVRRGSGTFELIKSGDAWTIRGRQSVEARPDAVDALLRGLATARPVRSLGAIQASERPTFGLDAPRVDLEIAMRGVQAHLRLGIAAAGQGSYLEVVAGPDEPGGVFVIGPELATLVDRDVDAYRDLSLVGASWMRNAARIEGHVVLERGLDPVVLERGLHPVVLERGLHGTYRVAQPDGTWLRAEPDVAQGLIGTLAELSADPLLDDAKRPEPLLGRVTVRSAEGEVRVVSFGGSCPGFPGRSIVQVNLERADGPVRGTGCVPSFAVERLQREPESFRDTHLLALPAGAVASKISEIRSIEVSAAGQKVFEAERRGEGLHVRIPEDFQSEREPAERWLERLAGLRCRLVDRVAPSDKASLGLEPPARTITVVRSDPTAELTARLDAGQAVEDAAGWAQRIFVGTPRGALGDPSSPIRVLREDDQALLECHAGELASLGGAAVGDLRSGNLYALKATSIARVLVRRGAEPLWEVTRASGVTELVVPAGLGVDVGAATQVFEQLASPPCLRWIDATSGPTTSPSPPDPDPLDVVVTADGRDEHLQLRNETADGIAVQRRGDTATCIVPKALRSTLLRIPADRGAVAFDPSTTPTLVVRSAGTRRSVTWSEATRSFSEVASDAGTTAGREVLARKIADALVGLRADGVLHVGPARPDDGLEAPLLTVDGLDERGRVLRTLTVGARSRHEGTSVYRVRVSDRPATYAVLREDVDRLLQLL